MTGESKAGKGADAGKSKAGKDVDAGKSKAGKGKGDGTLKAGSDHGSSKNAGWRDEMLKSMHGIHNKSQQEKPWDITKGPAPGLKYRGGSPPLPPAWDAQKGDLQAFSAGRGSLLFCGAARFEAICPRMRPPCSSS